MGRQMTPAAVAKLTKSLRYVGRGTCPAGTFRRRPVGKHLLHHSTADREWDLVKLAAFAPLFKAIFQVGSGLGQVLCAPAIQTQPATRRVLGRWRVGPTRLHPDQG